MNLWDYFQNNTGKKITKWTHYFWVYEKHFAHLRDKEFKMLEIGVLNGGSLEMWRNYFPKAKIVGIDINPDCRNHEQTDKNIFVRIGDQSNENFLQDLIDEFGEFDLILDDGSHHVDHVNRTFQYLYPKLKDGGIYFIEDTHAAYWPSHGGSINAPESIHNVAKDMIDSINADHARGQKTPDYYTKNVKCMTVYDSIIVFDKGNVGDKYPQEIGEGYRSPPPAPPSEEILTIRTD
jgi:23S rRNA U2552 (ribose-2'-O)-methylase RlmE/FtsJ